MTNSCPHRSSRNVHNTAQGRHPVSDGARSLPTRFVGNGIFYSRENTRSNHHFQSVGLICVAFLGLGLAGGCSRAQPEDKPTIQQQSQAEQNSGPTAEQAEPSASTSTDSAATNGSENANLSPGPDEVTAPRPTVDTNNTASYTQLAEYQVQHVGSGIYYESTAEGIRVTAVAEGSPAAEAGIKVDDVITSINSTPTLNLEAAELDALVNGKEGSPSTIVTEDGRSIQYSPAQFICHNMGDVRQFDADVFSRPDLEGLAPQLEPVAGLVIERKYRAAGQIMETLAAAESTNGSYYLMRAINTAASHGMLTSDSRNREAGSDLTLTDRIGEDVNLATELDERLESTAAELLCWLAVRIVIDAAENNQPITYINANEHLRWHAEPPALYRSQGDWLSLFRKGQELDSSAAARYLTGLEQARKLFLKSGDLASACFIQDVLAFTYSQASGQSNAIDMTVNHYASSLVIRLLDTAVAETPDLALQAGAVFNARCYDYRNTMLAANQDGIGRFLKTLATANQAAADIALRYYVAHNPPTYNRLGTPKEAFLFHMESFIQGDFENGFLASVTPDVVEVLDEIIQDEAWVKRLENNVFGEQATAMAMVMSGLLPEFAMEAATRDPLRLRSDSGAEVFLITFNLDASAGYFTEDVPMLVPMMAQGVLPTVDAFLEGLDTQSINQEDLQAATQAGGSENLVLAVVRKVNDTTYQVVDSPALKFLNNVSSDN